MDTVEGGIFEIQIATMEFFERFLEGIGGSL